MLIYNVTIKVDWSIQAAWLQWMQEVHIPEVMHTQCFVKYTFVKLLDIEDEDGPTYACQYYVLNQAIYEKYIAEYSHILRQAGMEKWGNKFIAFRTLMQVISE
jgi:Domain of unknown function (DUF4286)